MNDQPEHPLFTELRAVVERSITQEDRLLQLDAEMIEGNVILQRTFGDLAAGELELPADIKTMMAEFTRKRRVRYLQYLRAFLEDMSEEIR